jgi:heme exporter protein C
VTTSPPAPPPGTAAEAPAHTGSRSTRVVGVLAVVGAAVLAYFAFVVSGPDTEMGETVRLIYVHPPAATLAYTGCFLVTLGSALYLWKRSQWWDLVAQAGAELAAVFTALTLVTGMLWGRPTWGVYWVWDARLTSTAMLFLLLLGYLAMRKVPAEAGLRARRAAIVGCLLVPNVVIVNRSVEWWRSLHQQSTLVRLDPQIEGWQLFTLFLGFVVGGLVFAWLLIHRFRVAWLREQLEDVGLAEAIEARRAEAHEQGASAPASNVVVAP